MCDHITQKHKKYSCTISLIALLLRQLGKT